jgi:hypothetical protein
MSQFELDTLLLCAALELDTRMPGLCARAQGDQARPFSSFALALALLEGPSWDALLPDGPLRQLMLLRVSQPGATPLTQATLSADERIVAYLKGLNRLDDRLRTFLDPLPLPENSTLAAESQRACAEQVVRQWRRAALTGADSLPVALLLGDDPASKMLVAQTVAEQLGRRLYRVALEALPTQTGELETLARLWQRECLLLPLALLIDTHGADLELAERLAPLSRLLGRDMGLVMLSARTVPPALGAPAFSLDIARPLPGEQRAAWQVALERYEAPAAAETAGTLAGQFSLNLPEIERIVAEAASDGAAPEAAELWAACRDRSRPQLDRLAQRIEPRAGWGDLVVTPEIEQQLRAIAGQARQRSVVYEDFGFGKRMSRGLGIAALFTGESGTGKTLAAEVLAAELALGLYRIDLSAVVSKYIGETEKNLGRIFDAAEGGGAILFFDEADAIFGKRSEVKDSHDRYANIEINYLLQRMESYRGLAILATNMKSALDQAFVRRLRFAVDFSYPAPAERQRIWRLAFPDETPLEELDYDRLAKLSLSGGNIHNIAIGAAFMAAAARSAVTMDMVLAATQIELRKHERPDIRV